MLKHRVIPILLYDGSFCVHTKKFNRPARKLGPMNQYVRNMANRDIDELTIIDIDAIKDYRGPNFKKIRNICESITFCPITYGGGIRSIDDIKMLIKDCGVDKVIIKTNFNLIYDAARKFGSQAVVYACDIKFKNNRIFVHGNPPEISFHGWLRATQNEGAGEVILTDIDRQGTEKGYNYTAIKAASDALNIPLIANGGCGKPEHMVKAIYHGANAVAASTAFMLRSWTPQDCARKLQEAGLPARLSWAGQPQEASQQPA
jgi:cyclase